LFPLSQSEKGTLALPYTVPPRPSSNSTRRPIRLALALTAATAAILMGIIFTVSTGKGAVQLEFSNVEAGRQCKILVDGDEIRLENFHEPIKLRPGKHQLRILHGDLEIETREVDVLRHGKHFLHVSIPATAEQSRQATPAALPTAEAYASRGLASYDKAQFREAIADYSEAIRLQPKAAAYYLGRGKALAVKGEPDRAIADFNETIRLDPNNADAWASRGNVRFERGQVEMADADFREALRISPDFGWELLRSARRYDTLGQGNLYDLGERTMKRMHGHYFEVYLFKDAFGEKDAAWYENVLAGFRQRLRQREGIDPAWLSWVSCWLPGAMLGRQNPGGVVFVSDMPWVRSNTDNTGPAGRNEGLGLPISIAGMPYQKGIWTHACDDGRPADVVIGLGTGHYTSFKAHVGPQIRGSVEFQVLVDGRVRYRTEVLRFGMLRAINVDVMGGKELVLRVLNGGDGKSCDEACWGAARLVQAGAADPLEVPPVAFRASTDANAALFLAEAHWRLAEKELACRCYGKAVQWMEKNKTKAESLHPLRTEAAKLLEIPEEPSTVKVKTQAK
jgi:tetratricopeptide (TPR) repeat protein